MQRLTISLDDELLAELDGFAEAHGYANRSEAVRDLVRGGLQQRDASAARSGECVAALLYVYDHGARDLAGRLTSAFHHHHDLALATLHVHLDHDRCLEIAVLRGATADVRALGDHVIAERGVVHGRLVEVPVRIATEKHSHGAGGSHAHEHTRVRAR